MAAFVIAAFIVALAYMSATTSTILSPSCKALSIDSKNYPLTENGFSYACGLQSTSDGRLRISLNNYHFADGNAIQWQCSGAVLNGSASCSSSGIYMLVNATIENVGSGDAPIGPDFRVLLNESDGHTVGNGEFGANAVFPGQVPDTSVTSVSGGTYLPPGGTANYWFIFYIPGVTLAGTQSLTLRYLVWPEWSYGGTWSNGGFSCPCESPQVQLVVLNLKT
jgi:hypothetical protein